MNSIPKKFLVLLVLCFFGLIQCQKQTSTFKIDYEKYTLKNGLDVILHEDKSDPITAVAIQYHVGSSREQKGKTGFAHLFEHMMFQESQHIGQDQFFKKIQGAGGTLNGGTGKDGTTYFEVVPKNALEMVLWMEADRLGFLQSTVTQAALSNQQGVVKNEKRQGVDNQPYGYTDYILYKMLYPENHPYNWDVIGSMEDLTNATLKDVHEFYGKWYRPNNATLVVAGDFDKIQTKQWIEKYFGEIKSAGKIDDPKPQPVKLEKTKLAYHEDNFAQSPELNMVFPGSEQYHQDSYPLEILVQLLCDGKKAPMYKVIVEEKKLAPAVFGYHDDGEIAGEFHISVRAFPTVSLEEVKNAIFSAFEKFDKESFTDKDIDRIKANIETNFYNGISSVLGKSFQLARYNEYGGSPDYISTYLKNMLAVTKDDVLRVYQQYIKNKPFVMTSFVPKGKIDLIAKDSQLFPIEEETINAEEKLATQTAQEVVINKIPSSFDRTIEPVKGPDPAISLPKIWKAELANGLKVLGIEHHELPLIRFSLTIKGGKYLDNPQKLGTANLISQLMMEGTKNKTPLELEEAIKDLGARVTMSTSNEYIDLQATCLASKFNQVYALAEEILLEPRWDDKEFARIKEKTLERINIKKGNPNAISADTFDMLVFGKDHILGKPLEGTQETVTAITIDDLKMYYQQNFSPSVAFISIVGDITPEKAKESINGLATKWAVKQVTFPDYKLPAPIEKSVIYFVDVPNAKQSMIRVGCLALPYNHPDYYACTVMNYKLGGSFNGILNMILREEKGYTYGARSIFSGLIHSGSFAASSSVQSKVTQESVQIFKDAIAKYRTGISDQDLQFTKDALIKSNSRLFETLPALANVLNQLGLYNLADDYIKQQEEVVKNMTSEQHRSLAQKYLDPNRMIYLVVGDAATQMPLLEKIGYGKPVLVKFQ